MFKKYQHVERFGNDEVQGIELGECFIFPKIDGTNASVWLNEHGEVCSGSRTRELSLENDNAGFHRELQDNDAIIDFLQQNPDLRLYGEWLVSHSLKTYRDDAWRTFYVFDVHCDKTEKLLHYNDYAPLLDAFNITYIPPVAISTNPSYDQLLTQMERNTYLIKDDSGTGEGIVIKNYAFENRFGHTVWAKMVTTEFKDKHIKEMGAAKIAGEKMIEDKIVDDFVTQHLVDKTFDKIRIEHDDCFSSKNIGELLGRVFHDLVDEEIWNFVKKNKFPTINFKTLNTLTIRKVKVLKPELF